jgi:ribonuclease-3
MKTLDALQSALGCQFARPALLHLALTHPSVAHEHSTRVQHNQRLEFLGDSVVELILTHELYERLPSLGEGPLTKARARLVNRRFLADRARRLGLGQYLMLSRGEELHGGRERPSTLADAFEALIGALYLDQGLEATREFVLRQFAAELVEVPAAADLENPKGELQERLQATFAKPPEYRLESTTGPDHDRLFDCAVYHGGVELGRGRGKSKKNAEAEAAADALRRLGSQPPPVEPALVEPPPSPDRPASSGASPLPP